MAGWKLRKDKSAGASEDETQPPSGEQASEEQARIYEETPGESPQATSEEAPQFATVPESEDASVIAMPPSAVLPDFEEAQELHFDDEPLPTEPAQPADGPLTLVDYSSPEPAPASPAAAPAPSFETPAPDAPSNDFTSTLRMNRDELAAALAPTTPTGIPAVPPFVLDTPLVSPALEPATPRLVVRLGRLSAAFDITRDVMVIGRPDSATDFYPDVEIDLDDAVSRRHAEVRKHGDNYFLADTGSTNGTLLNGEKLPAQEERLLAHGDRIRVGERTEIIFE